MSAHECKVNGNSQGVFVPAIKSCDPVWCGNLPNIPHAAVFTNGYGFNSTATYTCGPGYRLSGNSQLTCQDTGEWSGPGPKCEGENAESLFFFILKSRLQSHFVAVNGGVFCW